MARTARASRPSSAELEGRRHHAIADSEGQFLPGFDEYLENNADVAHRFEDQKQRMEGAVRDADEANLEQCLNAWRKICQQVNETLAEEYRQANPDPELWELRFFKWMTRVVFIRFESPLGEFYLVPQRPKRKPKAKYWYTADEMIDMLHPNVAATITTFGQLPIRPESLEPPGPGERFIHIDATGDEPVIRYEGAPKNAGT